MKPHRNQVIREETAKKIGREYHIEVAGNVNGYATRDMAVAACEAMCMESNGVYFVVKLDTIRNAWMVGELGERKGDGD